jgi:sugar O-acyltransferase (sialic acid O-acetyltransferase NeuD family)
MKKVVIFGTGDMANVVYYCLSHESEYIVAAFTVDRGYFLERQFAGLPVVPFEEIEQYYPPQEYAMFVAIGYSQVNKIRAEKYFNAKEKGYQLISFISPKSVVSPDVEIGDNCIIFQNQSIDPFVRIGNDVVIWSNGYIGHHSVVKDHCFISPRVSIAGHVIIEPHCFLGVNATIRDGITIAQECIIGAGAVILDDTKEKGVYKAQAATLKSYNSSEFNTI